MVRARKKKIVFVMPRESRFPEGKMILLHAMQHLRDARKQHVGGIKRAEDLLWWAYKK